MRSFLDLRRASLTFAAFALFAGCATAIAAQTAPQKNAIARAENAYQAGDYPLAKALFEEIVTRDASPASIAIFRLATLRSWDNQLDDAVGLYRRYIVLEPRDAEGRLALARTLAWGGHYTSAIAIYDSLIASDQRRRDAVLGRAQT